MLFLLAEKDGQIIKKQEESVELVKQNEEEN